VFKREYTVRVTSVADPYPDDLYVFGPPVSGTISQRYRFGSGSGSGSFYHPAKIEIKKAMVPTFCDFFVHFYDVNVPSKSKQKFYLLMS
jgi:hypothetical protein